MRDPKKGAKAFAEANKALGDDIENFINAMQEFLKEFADLPPDLKQLSTLSTFRALGENSLEKFFGALKDFLNSFDIIIDVNRLVKSPTFESFNDPGLKKSREALWEFLNEFFENKLEKITSIQDLSELPAFKALNNRNIEDFLEKIWKLSRSHAGNIDVKDLLELSAFQALENDYKKSFSLAIRELTNKSNNTININFLVNHPVVAALYSQSVEKFLKFLLELSNQFNTIDNLKALSALPNIKNLNDQGASAFLATIGELAKRSACIVNIKTFKELVIVKNLDSQTVANLYSAILDLMDQTGKVFDVKALIQHPTVVQLPYQGARRFLLALQEFSAEFKGAINLRYELWHEENAAHQVKNVDFLYAIVDISNSLDVIAEFKADVEIISSLTGRFLSWSQELSGKYFIKDERNHTDAYLESLFTASFEINFYLIKNYLVKCFRLSEKLLKKIKTVSSFTDLNELLKIFKAANLRNFDEADETFFRLQITKTSSLPLLTSQCLRLRRFIKEEELSRIQAEIEKLYACNSLIDFYKSVESINVRIKNICDKYFEQDKKNESIEEFAKVGYFPALKHFAKECRRENPVLAQPWLELAFITAIMAGNNQDKEEALNLLKQVYAEINATKGGSLDKRKSRIVEINQITDFLPGTRKSLQLEIISEDLKPNDLLENKIKNILISGNQHWHYGVGELLLNRFVFLTVGIVEVTEPPLYEEEALEQQSLSEKDLLEQQNICQVESLGQQDSSEKKLSESQADSADELPEPLRNYQGLVNVTSLGRELYAAYLFRKDTPSNSDFTKELAECKQIREWFLSAFHCSDLDFESTTRSALDSICNYISSQFIGNVAIMGYFSQDADLIKLVLESNKEKESGEQENELVRSRTKRVQTSKWESAPIKGSNVSGSGRPKSGIFLQQRPLDGRRASSADVEGGSEKSENSWVFQKSKPGALNRVASAIVLNRRDLSKNKQTESKEKTDAENLHSNTAPQK